MQHGPQIRVRPVVIKTTLDKQRAFHAKLDFSSPRKDKHFVTNSMQVVMDYISAILHLVAMAIAKR